ncbi:MAG TPA: TonB-dependent receptor [Agitococcus sp.]|nr:TonB-dependent receptor [Agitococcus sp.]
MRKSLLASAITLLTCQTYATADDFLFAEQEMPVVLSATRLKQAVADAPASVTIIDRQMIAQSGAREIPDVLRLVPGMVVGYEKGWDAFVSYHGTSADMARRMQVLVDGRSVFQPSLAFVDWIGLPLELDDIDRIEVIRGPNAAAYGANSFLAIVNIITRNPADLPTVRAYTRQGGEGINDNFVSYAGVKNQFSWQLSANQRNDDGFDKYYEKHNLLDAQGNKIYDKNGDPVKIFNPYPYADDKRQKAIYGQGILEGNTYFVKIAAGHSEMVAGNRADSGLVTFLNEPDLKSKQDYLNISLENNTFSQHQIKFQTDFSQFESKQQIRVKTPAGYFIPELQQLFVQDRVYTDNFLNAVSKILAGKRASLPTVTSPQIGALTLQVACKTGLQQGKACGSIKPDPVYTKELIYLSDINKKESRLEAEIQDTWTINPNLRIVYGVGIQDSRADSLHYFNGEVENTVWRVFAHGEWQFMPDWRLNAGIMDEHDDYSGSLKSPRLALNWRFLPTHSLRLVSSRAYRTPDLRESKAYWQYTAYTEDRSLSKYDGNFPFLGQAPSPVGQTCVRTNTNTGVMDICTDGAPSERITSAEIGYYGELPKQHLQLDIRVFKDNLKLSEHNLEIDDFVIAPLVEHQQRGVELSTQWRPHANWRFMLNYAYDDITGGNDNTDFVPKHSGNFGAWYDTGKGIQSSVNYVFYNQLYNDPDDGGLYFDRLDWRVAKKWSMRKLHDVELSGVWQIRLTEDRELRRSNGSPRDKMWLQLSYAFD